MAVIKTEKLICDVCGKEITDSSGRLHCVLKMNAAINGKHVEIKKGE